MVLGIIPVAKSGSACDVLVGPDSNSLDTAGYSIAHCLNVKGYCTFDLGLDADLLKRARDDAGLLSEAGKLSVPSTLFLEGLLGSSGSARIAELEYHGDLESLPGISDHPSLSALDLQMTKTVEIAYPYLGFKLASRTAGVLHEAGSTEGREAIDDFEAEKWLSIFAHHKLMIIIFLGPDEGLLEMRPFDEDAASTKVIATPGTAVILRPDALSHNFFVRRGEAFCLSCFYTKDARPKKRVADDDEDLLTPCAAALDDWARKRVQEVKEVYNEDDPSRPQLPRHWELISNLTGFVGQHMALRACAIRNPSTWEMPAFYAAAVPNTDFVTEVPICRFDVETVYEEGNDPDAWKRQKCNHKHGAFAEGIELFDSKLFRLSPAETMGMDPGHRMTLETCWEALAADGYTMKALMNSRGGVYCAADTQAEWQTTDKPPTSGVCGGGNSVCCGRVSFTLGMKGPCLASDCAHAGGLLVLSQCCTQLSHRGLWDPPPFSVVSSYHLCTSRQKWIFFGAGDLVSSAGRCFSFDASASGMTRGESCVAMCVRPLVSMVDDNPVINEETSEGGLGTLAGSAINQNGRRASLLAPDGAAEQECITMALRNACISPLDVDAVDCHALGHILSDAVEASSCARAYRPDGMIGVEQTAPLRLMASKTRVSDFYDVAGLVSILEVVYSLKYGISLPTGHLRVLNPHIDLLLCERPAAITQDIMEHRLTSAFCGVTARSFSGTNVHFLQYGQVDEIKCPPYKPPSVEREKIVYWPEGGGKLDPDQVPRSGYYIAGSWSKFESAQMQNEGSGVYGYTVTLGENRWEHFQIWADDQKDKSLHPGMMKAGKNSKVVGPEEAPLFNTWLLDGRAVPMWKTLGGAADWSYVDVETSDTGKVGEKYRVQLRLSGKFRTVEWHKLEEAAEPLTVPGGDYYVVGTWSDLDWEPMVCDDAENGVFSVEVQLPDYRGDFLIVRDKDWMQVFSPGPEDSENASGPEAMQLNGAQWCLEGRPGDIFKITFQRAPVVAGTGLQKVSWTKAAHDSVSEAVLARQRIPEFHVIGSWDRWANPIKMNWTGYYYQFFVELGYSEQASFQFLKDANFLSLFFPSIPQASLGDKYDIEGPGRPESNDFCWIIGKDDWSGKKDRAAKGKRYEVRLFVENGNPKRIEWAASKKDAPLEDAFIRGFYAYEDS